MMLEDWNTEIRHEYNNLTSSRTTEGLSQVDSLFGLEPRAEFLCRGRGFPVGFAAASDTLFVATSRGFLLRHDISGVTNVVSELEVLRSVDSRILRLFVDPLGLHVLLTVQTGSLVEFHHVDGALKKNKPLAKLKGVDVTAVGWSPRTQAHTIRDVVLGSAAGAVYTLNLEEGSKEKVKEVLQVSDQRRPISGLQQADLGSGKRLLLVLCISRLFIFRGCSDLEQALLLYSNGSRSMRYIELPLEEGPYQLHTLCSQSQPDAAAMEGTGVFEIPQPQEFAVLSPSGIYYGQLNLDPSLVDETDHLVKHHLLPAVIMQQQQHQNRILDQQNAALFDSATALGYTKYHFVLLFPSKLVFLNRISKQIVQEISVDRFLTPVRGVASAPLDLSKDHVAGRVVVMAGDDAFEIDIANEDRDMWRVYLDKGEFSLALAHCLTPHQRNAVSLAHGEFLFEEEEFEEAAKLFGKLTCTMPSFEDLALRLIETGNGDAVLAFLSTRLDTLGREDKAQCTMVATWLTEIMLDQINRALLDKRGPEGEIHYSELVHRLRHFLQQNVVVLDPGTTVSILSGYGRVEELMFYAKCTGNDELLLEYLLQRGEAEKALEVLRKPSVSPELFYKFASTLICLAPSLCVQSWINAQPPLAPSRLLPALLQFGESSGPGYSDALKYVDFCLNRLGSTDVAIHNFAVSLLSLKPESEDSLLDFLKAARDPLDQPLYDIVHALRIVLERGRFKAAVTLYCELSMWDDAVSLALVFDQKLAIKIAKKTENNEHLGRKLWLQIAKHIIEQEGGAQIDESVLKIVILLEEASGTLRIEDVLPLFPDFVQIGAVQSAICRALEKYNQEMKDLRHDMQMATSTAEAIRNNLGHLEDRVAVLDLAQQCAYCQRPIFQPPPSLAGPTGGHLPLMYLFPSGNAFHCSCLCMELSSLAPPPQKLRISQLVEHLTEVDGNTDASVVKEWKRELEANLTIEDPYTGDLVCRNISKPFINVKESASSRTWEL